MFSAIDALRLSLASTINNSGLNTSLWQRCGDAKTIADSVMLRRPGHQARMSDNRVLFGWLPQSQPRCGPRRRYIKDLIHIDVDEGECYKALIGR